MDHDMQPSRGQNATLNLGEVLDSIIACPRQVQSTRYPDER